MGRAEGLSNLELAANKTWVTALTRCECPECGYACAGVQLVRLNTPCPNCGASGEARILFPGVVHARRLEIVAECYVAACAHASQKKADLVKQIRQDLGITCDGEWAQKEARRLQVLVGRFRGSNEAYKRYIEGLQGRVCLNNADHLSRLIALLSTYTDTTLEHCNVVTATVSLFEGVFCELLVRLLVSRGKARPEAKEAIPRAHKKRLGMFAVLTGVPAKAAVDQYGVRGLYESWQELTSRRNSYLHTSPWAAGARSAEKAFNAAKHSFGLFALLNNTYCARPRVLFV